MGTTRTSASLVEDELLEAPAAGWWMELTPPESAGLVCPWDVWPPAGSLWLITDGGIIEPNSKIEINKQFDKYMQIERYYVVNVECKTNGNEKGND